MKTLVCIAAMWFMLSIVFGRPAEAQTQVAEGVTVVQGPLGPQVCLGRWVPSGDIAIPGVCQGQMFDVAQLTALSSQLSTEKLDQLLRVILSIDQRMAINNDQVKRLIEVTADNKTLFSRQAGESLRSAITKRFNALPKEVVADNLVRTELTRLKEGIFKDIEKHSAHTP